MAGHAMRSGVQRCLPAYLDEFEFRFNNRDNPYIFRDAMRQLLGSENVEYKELVA